LTLSSESTCRASLLGEVGDHHVGAGGGETADRGGTETAGAADDEGAGTGELHGVLLWKRVTRLSEA
jgi:hypothetical protein